MIFCERNYELLNIKEFSESQDVNGDVGLHNEFRQVVFFCVKKIQDALNYFIAEAVDSLGLQPYDGIEIEFMTISWYFVHGTSAIYGLPF